MVQYSTSVKHQLTITEENNDKYSCEVKKENGFDKKEIRLVIESEFFHKRIKWGEFLKKLWCLFSGEYYWDDLVLLFAELNISPWRRANPPNVSFKNPLRWQIFIVNSVDKTKLLIYK